MSSEYINIGDHTSQGVSIADWAESVFKEFRVTARRALVKSLTYGTSNSEEAVSMGVGVESSNLSSMIMVQAVAWSPGSIDKSQSSLPLEVTAASPSLLFLGSVPFLLGLALHLTPVSLARDLLHPRAWATCLLSTGVHLVSRLGCRLAFPSLFISCHATLILVFCSLTEPGSFVVQHVCCGVCCCVYV